MILQLKRGIKSVARFIYMSFYSKPRYILSLISSPDKYCKHISYYPEKAPKTKYRVLLEQLSQTLRYGYPNEFYFSYGFDVKSKREMSEYLHYAPFSILRNKYNLQKHSSTAILRNKFFFGMFCEYLGVNSGDNIGLITKSSVYLPHSKRTMTIDSFCTQFNGDYFVKLIDGECGCGIFTLSLDNGMISLNGKQASAHELLQTTNGGKYLIQTKITQHPLMASLHPQSLNSIRLVTIKNINTGKITVFPSILRIGTGLSFVDNTSQGGIAVGINISTGHLNEYGFLKPQFGGRIDRHPDSKIKFAEFQIPYFKEALDQAIHLHSMLPDIHSIGWDIAIGINGPVFIEGNDNWEINGPQICHGGLKNIFENLLLGK